LARNELIHQSLLRAGRLEKLVTLGLLIILLVATIIGLSSVLTGLNLDLLWKSLFLGLLIGWMLGIFQQPAWRSACIVIALGLTYTLLFTTGLSDKLIIVIVDFVHLVIQGVIAIFHSEMLPESSTLVHSFENLVTSTGIVIERVYAWITAIIDSQPIFDPVAAAFVWSILTWIQAAWAGWVIERRRNALLATFPMILLGIIALSYRKPVSISVYWMLASLLLLLVTVQHDQREQRWDQTGVAYPRRKGQQIGTIAFGITVALVLLSALIASLSLQSISGWIGVQGGSQASNDGNLARSLGIVTSNSNPAVFSTTVRRPGLPRELLIGSGPDLSKQIVMTVAVNDLLTISQAGQPRPLYWRSFTYDIYTGRGWRTSAISESDYQANQPLEADHAPGHTLIQQVVRFVNANDSSFYAAGIPVVINILSHEALRSSDDLFGIQIEKIDSYTTQSLIPQVDVGTLRNVSVNYPEWVQSRYLTLPPEVPGRVKQLAIELTASQPTGFDRARAIEEYLRKIPYTLDVPRPPTNQDLVDFFLFDLRRGYCDYYASAMVVLARAAGIPARLAIGYANGTYNLNSERFVVSEADAHSWVEIYFPGVGWIPFEPTAARPQLEGSQLPAPQEPSLSPSTQFGKVLEEQKPFSWEWLILLGIFPGGFILLVTWMIYDNIQLRQLSRPQTAATIYRRMRRYGALLEVSLEPGDTPYEFSTTLNSRIQELIPQHRNKAFRRNTALKIKEITNLIVWSSYRPLDFVEFQGPSILLLWKPLRWQLWSIWIRKVWKALHEFIRSKFSDITVLFKFKGEEE
jgi:transglutaminase-like putative cysteine protease